MTDHSLRGYLQRRTIEELEGMLVYCLQEDNYANYEYVILEILSILREWDKQKDDMRSESLDPITNPRQGWRGFLKGKLTNKAVIE